MLFFLAESTPIYAFQQSDTIGRLIVLVLFLASIAAWSILVEKWLHLRKQEELIGRFLDTVERLQSPLGLFLELEHLDGPLRVVADRCLRRLADCMGHSRESLLREFTHNRIPRFLNEAEVQRLNAAMEECVDQEILHLEARLGMLGTIVSASPFLGLLGTVWGVLAAFTGMAIQGNANIDAIAPGVSGALLTTVVGLLVAIPALFGYNAMTYRVRRITIQMDNFAAGFGAHIKAHFQPGEDDK